MEFTELIDIKVDIKVQATFLVVSAILLILKFERNGLSEQKYVSVFFTKWFTGHVTSLFIESLSTVLWMNTPDN